MNDVLSKILELAIIPEEPPEENLQAEIDIRKISADRMAAIQRIVRDYRAAQADKSDSIDWIDE